MSEVVAAQKSKKIAKAGPGRQVRLWVRAKFLSFKRYSFKYSDPKLLKTPVKLSSDWRESMIELLPHTTSERELHTSTKLTPARPRIDSEYFCDKLDHLGKNQQNPRKHWSSNC
jgi:hypothetical protein